MKNYDFRPNFKNFIEGAKIAENIQGWMLRKPSYSFVLVAQLHTGGPKKVNYFQLQSNVTHSKINIFERFFGSVGMS